MGVIPSLVPLIHPPEVGSSDLPASDKRPVNLPRVMMMMMCVCCTEKDTRFDDTKELKGMTPLSRTFRLTGGTW